MKDTHSHGEEHGTDRDTLYLIGGVALLTFAAGLILTNKTVRRYLGRVAPGDIISAAVPDLERYMKLRSM